MTIYTTSKRFAQIPEGAACDTRISANAYRLLGAMYGNSFPVKDSSDRTVGLSRTALMGCANIDAKSTFYNVLQELIDAGWVKESRKSRGGVTVYVLPAKDSGTVEYTPNTHSIDYTRSAKKLAEQGLDDEVVHVDIDTYDNDSTYHVDGDTQKYSLDDGLGAGKVSKKRDKAVHKVTKGSPTKKTTTQDTPVTTTSNTTNTTPRAKALFSTNTTPAADTPAPRKRLKRVVKDVTKRDTPVERDTNVGKRDFRPTVSRPVAPVETKPAAVTVLHRFDTGEVCDDTLVKTDPEHYKIKRRNDGHGNYIPVCVVDYVTIGEDGLTEEDRFGLAEDSVFAAKGIKLPGHD